MTTKWTTLPILAVMLVAVVFAAPNATAQAHSLKNYGYVITHTSRPAAANQIVTAYPHPGSMSGRQMNPCQAHITGLKHPTLGNLGYPEQLASKSSLYKFGIPTGSNLNNNEPYDPTTAPYYTKTHADASRDYNNPRIVDEHVSD